MSLVVRADVGPIMMQVRDFGAAAPSRAPQMFYTSGKWAFRSGVRLEHLKGPRGVEVATVPFLENQGLDIEAMETGHEIEAARLLGTATYGAAAAAPSLELVDAFAIGAGLNARASVVTALAAIGGGALAADVVPSLYELRLTLTNPAGPVATGALWRISPIPQLLADTTEVFGVALTPADFASFFTDMQGAADDTGSVVFAVHGPSDGNVELDFTTPAVPRVDVVAMSGRESGNSFAFVRLPNCVVPESTFEMERGAVANVPTSFLCLGGGARFVQRDYAADIAAVSGIA